jgi:hypothetical protein
MRTMKALSAVSALSMGVAACGGFGAGDIEVYRVTLGQKSSSGDCDDLEGTNTFRSSDRWVLMATDVGGDVEYLLDLGGSGSVIAGVETDGGYTFNGRLDTEVFDEDGTTVTAVLDTTVVVSDEGGQLSGSITTKNDTRCSGDCEFFPTSNCTEVRNFVAVLADEPGEAVFDDGSSGDGD